MTGEDFENEEPGLMFSYDRLRKQRQDNEAEIEATDFKH